MKLLRLLPNLLTASRLLLALPIALVIQSGRFEAALAIAFVAGLTDALDGFLARRLNARSRLGAALDPLADKTMIFAVFLSLANENLLPWSIAGIVIVRDVVIVSGALAYHLLIGELEFSPTALSKANMGVQVIFLLSILTHAAYGIIPSQLLQGLTLLMLAVTITSGLQYVLMWARKAIIERRGITRD